VIIAHEYGDETAERIIALLPQSAGVAFYTKQSLSTEELHRLVTTGEYECAYIIPGNLTERVLTGDISGAVEVITSSGTVITAISDRLVFAAIIDALAPEITAGELAEITGIPADIILPDIREGFASYNDSHMFVAAQTSWAGSGGEDGHSPASPLAMRLPYGITALGMLALAFASLPEYLVAKEKLRRCLRIENLVLYCVAVYTALILRILMVGAAAIFTISVASGGGFAPVFLPTMAYALVCAGITIILAMLLRSGTVPDGGLPFVIGVFTLLCCLLMGGVVIDPAELGGVLYSASRVLPTSYYIEAVISALA